MANPQDVDARSWQLPPDVVSAVERAGYHPLLVNEVLDVAVAGADVEAFLVHQETMFDRVEVRRHVTVLVLTPSRLIIAHADEHEPDALTPEAFVSASTESVALSAVRSVVLTHAVSQPQLMKPGQAPRELTLSINWGSLSRVDMEPANCPDPNCEADHGYTGTLAADDISLRISRDAEGEDALRAALAFAKALSNATSN